MRTEIRFHDLPHSPSLAEWAERCARRLEERFGRQLRTLELRLSDTNGPRRGGIDKRCHLIASGPKVGILQVVETHRDAYACVEFAMFRLGRAVGRALGGDGGGGPGDVRGPAPRGPGLAA